MFLIEDENNKTKFIFSKKLFKLYILILKKYFQLLKK